MKGKNILDAMNGIAPETLAENEPARKPAGKTIWRVAALAAAVLLLVGGIVAGAVVASRKAPVDKPDPTPVETVETKETKAPAAAVRATVFIDVNPSVKIEIDEDNKVLSLAAVNEDGEVLLENYDYAEKGLSAAVSDLVSLLIEKEYLNKENNLVLLTVNSEDEHYSASLCAELREAVNGVFEKELPEGEVVAQILVTKEALLDCAQKYGISWGKAKMVLMLAAKDETANLAELAKMKISDLMALCDEKEVEIIAEATLTEYDARALAYADAGVDPEKTLSQGWNQVNGSEGITIIGINFCYEDEYYVYTYDATSATLLSKTHAPYISEDEAIEITRKAWGVSKDNITKIRSSIMFESFPNDGLLYLVTLRRDKEREFSVKINAVTGEIMEKYEDAVRLDAMELRDYIEADLGFELPWGHSMRGIGFDSCMLMSFIYNGYTYSYLMDQSTGEIYDKEVFEAPGIDAPFEYVNEAFAGRLAQRILKKQYALPDVEVIDCTIEFLQTSNVYLFRLTLSAGDARYTCTINDQARVVEVKEIK